MLTKTQKTEILYYLYDEDPEQPHEFIYGSNGDPHKITYFSSIEAARNIDRYQGSDNKAKYKIGNRKIITKTEVDVETLEDNLDPATKEDIKKYKRKLKVDNYIKSKLDEFDKTYESTDLFDILSKKITMEIDLRFMIATGIIKL